MSKLNWDKLARRDRAQKIAVELAASQWLKKKKLKPLSAEFIDLFERAIRNAVNTRHYAPMLAMQRFAMTKGFLSKKQGDYLRDIANKKERPLGY